MNAIQQKRFVKELIKRVEEKIVADIDAGKTPDEWDGVELRWLIGERFEDCIYKHTGGKRRKAEFDNTVLVNNL
jgi:hypothetical protein